MAGIAITLVICSVTGLIWADAIINTDISEMEEKQND